MQANARQAGKSVDEIAYVTTLLLYPTLGIGRSPASQGMAQCSSVPSMLGPCDGPC